MHIGILFIYMLTLIRNHVEIMIIRFLSCAIMLVSKLSLVIGLMRLDIVNSGRLAYIILLDWIK